MRKVYIVHSDFLLFSSTSFSFSNITIQVDSHRPVVLHLFASFLVQQELLVDFQFFIGNFLKRLKVQISN